MSELQRLDELLAERATQGLAPALRSELAALLRSHPEEDDDSFDLAAAAIHLALLPGEETMPAGLRQAVAEQAKARAVGAGVTAPVVSLESRRSRGSAVWAPWLAAAAALVVALAGWWPRLRPAPPVEPSPPAETLVQQVEQEADVLRLALAATEDAAAREARGDVLWSGSAQRGFLRIRGLEANDPGELQYQLWIFDRARDERYPVDGGVFDMPTGGGEALIPIDAKIAVDEPYLFAVTVEKPGGVVVSSRERIVLLAQV